MIAVQHGVLIVGGRLFLGRRLTRAVVQRTHGGGAIALHHRERVLQLNTILGQLVQHIAAHVHRHRFVPGQQDSGQITRAGRLLCAVQQHRPRILTV